MIYSMKKSIIVMLIASAILIAGIMIAGLRRVHEYIYEYFHAIQ